MLELRDPLWAKLDDAHCDRDIPEWLSELAESWDEDEAKSLFWDYLCHQETCYGATYAAVPHLLKIAQIEENRQQRLEIAIFLGLVTLSAFDLGSRHHEDLKEAPLQGLPRTLEDWDRKLDVYRSLVASLEDSNRPSSPYEQDELLPRYRNTLATDPVTESDLDKIQQIRTDFLQSLPKIRDLCQQAFHENRQDQHTARYLLSGVAAADGLLNLGHLLKNGPEGGFKCSSCGWEYQYLLFGDRVAVYADEPASGVSYPHSPDDDRAFQDYRDGAPSRSDGFVLPLGDSDDVSDRRITALLTLADQAPNPEPALLLRCFLGEFACSKCGIEARIRGF